MEITKKHQNSEELLLTFSGRLDFTVRKPFQHAISEISSEKIKQVILDFTEVSFIDCSALGILLQAKQQLGETQTGLSIISTPGRVLDVLQSIHLDQMIPITTAP